MEVLFYFFFVIGNVVINRVIQKKEVEKDNGKKIINEKSYFIKNYTQFLNLFETKKEEENNVKKYSDNIESVFYNKNEFSNILSDENNNIENVWKTRVLYESTPRGNIIMYYDVYKQGFAYYCDQSFVSYNLLSAVAMKYVIYFRCLDFFIDELMLQLESNPSRLSPLVEIFDEKQEKNKTVIVKTDVKTDDNFNPFAKLKNYKMTDSIKPKDKNQKQEQTVKLLVKNRFINKGKIREFTFIKKIEKKQDKPVVKTGYDGLFSSSSQSGGENNRNSFKSSGFSYRDFKENKDKIKNNKIEVFV